MLMIPPVRGLRVNTGGGRPLPARWHWDSGRFPDYDLWLACGGEGVVQWAETRIGFTRGDCFLFRPGDEVRIDGTNKGDVPLLHAFMHFDLVDKHRRVVRLPAEAQPPVHRRLRQFALVETLVEKAVQAFRQGTDAGQREARTWLMSALYVISHEDEEQALSGPDLEHLRRIESLCQRIEAQPGKTFRVPDMARELYYSTEHFTRLFKRFKGMSPGAYVIHVRMDAACELLLNSSLPITAIAEALGYRDVYFFSKQFRQHMGMAPTAYRGQGGRASL